MAGWEYFWHIWDMKQTNTKPDHPETNNPWLQRIKEVIEKKLVTGDLTNDVLALEVGISERHLFRRMKDLTGYTPQQYIRQYRLEQAMQFLKDGTFRTVKDTAQAVGYINISYFINQFEKKYGQKPLEVLQERGWR